MALLNSEDLRGGAARAAFRLHEALRAQGVDASMLVQIKRGGHATVIGPPSLWSQAFGRLRPALDLVPLKLFTRWSGDMFYPGWLPDRVPAMVKRLAPDLVHLHWITGGFLNVLSLKSFGRPLVWTLHDMWAFTGGCHYDGGCGRYLERCGRCPILRSRAGFDLSRIGWSRKERAYRDLPLRIVAPSRWLGDLARGSPLLGRFPVSVIPNAIDTAVFSPVERPVARKLLNLPQDRKLILFGAMRSTGNPRKGFAYLQSALRLLSERKDAAGLAALVFGADQPRDPPHLGLKCIYLGTLADDVSLRLTYAAADVFVAPSTQENLSNTVMEALACGTPVVAFRVGGMADMIEHRRNGYLAEPFDTADLANGLQWVLDEPARHRQLSSQAAAKAQSEYAYPVVAARYRALYEDALQSAGP